MQFSNKSALGFNSIWWGTGIYIGLDGVPFIGAKVKCSGFGFKSCPKRNVGPEAVAVPTVQLEAWESAPIDAVVNHAWSEMDLGNGSGSYFVNYLNTSTGITYRYTISWNTTYFADISIDEISYTIDRTIIPVTGGN